MVFQGWLDDLYSEGIKEGIDGKAQNKGLFGKALEYVVDEEALKTKAQGVMNRGAADGIPLSSLQGINNNSSTQQVADAVYAYKKDEKKQDRLNNKADTIELTELTQAPQMAQIEAQTEATKDSNQLLREQMVNQNRMDLLDRADARDARATELQYMMMKDAREDRRYNQQLEREDRRLRQDSINTLVAGLANLGAAFAF